LVYAPRLAPGVEPATALHEVRRSRLDESWVSRNAEEDFQFALSARRNVLVTGPDHRVTALLQRLQTKHATVVSCGSARLDLPLPTVAGAGDTLVLRDVDTLTAEEQHRLAGWIASNDNDVHLITTASTSLLPLIDAGDFNATLYYRINIVYIALDEHAE